MHSIISLKGYKNHWKVEMIFIISMSFTISFLIYNSKNSENFVNKTLNLKLYSFLRLLKIKLSYFLYPWFLPVTYIIFFLSVK